MVTVCWAKNVQQLNITASAQHLSKALAKQHSAHFAKVCTAWQLALLLFTKHSSDSVLTVALRLRCCSLKASGFGVLAVLTIGGRRKHLIAQAEFACSQQGASMFHV
jgi:hypothetical protein